MADHPLKPATDRRLGRPLPHQLPNQTRANPLFPRRAYPVLLPVSRGYPELRGIFPRVTHPSAAHPEGRARLACVRPAASVRSEPGSNSQVETHYCVSLTFEPLHISIALPPTGYLSAICGYPNPARIWDAIEVICLITCFRFHQKPKAAQTVKLTLLLSRYRFAT